jgi:hypothetical protein
MRPVFFDQPPYRLVLGIACAIWYVSELIGTFFQRSARRHGTRHNRSSYAFLVGTLWAGIILSHYGIVRCAHQSRR